VSEDDIGGDTPEQGHDDCLRTFIITPKNKAMVKRYPARSKSHTEANIAATKEKISRRLELNKVAPVVVPNRFVIRNTSARTPKNRPRRRGNNPAPGIRKLPMGTWRASRQIHRATRRKAMGRRIAVVLGKTSAQARSIPAILAP
jgi:hypothetical protein